jgi:alpha-beta hydrolase superfamily lysophospholipase
LNEEQLQALRQDLPKLAAGAAPAPSLLEFCQFYGIDPSARPGLDYRAGTLPSGDYTLMVHQWLQPDASHNLLVVHGYFDHTGLFGKLIEHGLARHCNVICFDLPGHGLSSGEPAVVDDFADYSRAVADVLAAAQWPELPRWVMAQSTGCAALIDFADKYPWPFEHTVLLAPLVRPVGWQRIQLGNRLLRPFVESITRRFNENSSDRAFLAFIASDPLQAGRISLRWIAALRNWLAALQVRDLGVGPALVIQGVEDGTVDWRFNMPVIGQLFPGSRFYYLPGAGHQLANESAAIREYYLAKVDDYLGFPAADAPSPELPASAEIPADPQKTSAPQ